MIAITKLLLSSQEVWVDELAATSDGSAMARWALLSALESALELRLTTPGAVVRLRVALPPSPDSRCAYGMYREQLHLHDGVPELPGPWQHDHTGPGCVLMHGLVDALAARLRLVLATRPNVPGTQFYWRATGAASDVSSSASVLTASLPNPLGTNALDGAAVPSTPVASPSGVPDLRTTCASRDLLGCTVFACCGSSTTTRHQSC